MRKIIFILTLVSLFFNCKTVEQKNTQFYYPRITNFKNDSILTKINLDSIKNYRELIKITDKIVYSGKLPVLKFNSGKTNFIFLVFKMCSESNVIADYSGKNIISIENNRVIINDHIEKPIDSLKLILQNHILNPEKQSDYSENIEQALISYYQDSLFGMEKIKKQLIKIATEFNELNQKNGDSLPLKIKPTDYQHTPIKIPIPPPLEK